MEVERDRMLVTVNYKLKNYTAEVPVDATVGFLGKQLSELTGVVLSTMRLLVPKGKRFGGSTVVEPASELHSSSALDESGITSGIVIRMMGVTTEELKEVMKPVKEDRVLGFAEEEDRRRARRQPARQGDAKSRLPKGPYTFHEFRVLELPNVLLNPPPEKARALLYKLAADPGIVGIMNKHKWQVGILSELAPKGYVGISPKCLLGQNMNRGQDISLRLRTDDLQGFRKYGSIKKTLLHELAHMVHDEHDEHFHALDKQLNQEAIELDWTNTAGRTLSGVAIRGLEDDDEPMDAGGVTGGRKLGGGLPPTPNARSAAIQAARIRFEQNKLASNSSKIDPSESGIQVETLSTSLLSSRRAVEKINEPDPDEKAAVDEIAITAEGTEPDGREPHDNQKRRTEPDPDESTFRASVHASLPVLRDREPDPDDSQAKPDLQGSNTSRVQEPDPDDMLTLSDWIKTAQRFKATIVDAEPDPDESMSVGEERNLDEPTQREEPDPDESSHREEPDPDESMHREEPDPDESLRREEPDPDESLRREEPDPDESLRREEPDPDESLRREEPDPDESLCRDEPDPDESLCRDEPDPDESMDSEEPGARESLKSHENGLDLDVEPLNEELVRILDAASAAVIRLQQAILHIRQQATPAEATMALHTLSTILSNVVNNPNEGKFKVIRKMNYRFHNDVGRFEGAVEFLRAVGFSEGEPAPGAGGSDCFVLKTSDPGLLWLALSVLQPLVA